MAPRLGHLPTAAPHARLLGDPIASGGKYGHIEASTPCRHARDSSRQMAHLVKPPSLIIGGVTDGRTRACRSSANAHISYRLGGIAGAAGGPAGIDPIATIAERLMACCPAAGGAA
eukprot:6540602-Pyramimonas_sp.AAC.1